MATATSLITPAKNAYDVVAAGTTDSVLVVARSGFKLRVAAYTINQGDATPSTVTFNSKGAGAGTAIWFPMKYPANGGTNSPVNGASPSAVPLGWFETLPGEGLTVTTGAGSSTGVGVVYFEIPAR